MATDHAKWFRVYDSSPAADVDLAARYRKETSDDDGRTWEFPRQMTGEHLRLDMTEALLAGFPVEHGDGVATFRSPHPTGGLIRYTLIH
jgi:hypothetical protein